MIVVIMPAHLLSLEPYTFLNMLRSFLLHSLFFHFARLPWALANSVKDSSTITKPAIITKPGCQRTCGNLTVPYPFGIGVGSGCSIDPQFDIACNISFDPPKAFRQSSTIEVIDISDSQVRITNLLASACYNRFGEKTTGFDVEYSLASQLTFSDANEFFVVGCNAYGEISATGWSTFKSERSSRCHSIEAVDEGDCEGTGCNQVSLPKGLWSFNVSVYRDDTTNDVSSFNPCFYAFVAEKDSFILRPSDLNDPSFENRTTENVPIVLDWVIGNQTCSEAQKSKDYACLNNSNCTGGNTDIGGGYRCKCFQGYEGNPYVDPGCTDIDECYDSPCDPNATCHNTEGSYYCTCLRGFTGDGTKQGRGCTKLSSQFPVMKLAFGLGFGLLALIIVIVLVYFFWQKRKLIKLRQKFFEQNGGLLLQKRISSNEEMMKSSRIFTAEELEKATNNYATDCILGKGGYGVVYRGILADHRQVAIKKARIMDVNQIEPFINEVTILAHINHRNVVKLLGCCLETEVPLLVYEYVSNGTLFYHIHHSMEMPWFSWDNRLRIAAEVSGALAYLHSYADIPIIHRDVKSPNILLDEFYTAKIADFGASRLVPIDRTQVTTLVQGTLGYLDPEYFNTSQLTEKSDVYSFGVVLAELLTGELPVSTEKTGEEKNLATYFAVSVDKNILFRIVQPRILQEGSLEQISAVAELVTRCVKAHGNERPTMKEVTTELERLRKYKSRTWDEEKVRGESTRFASENADLYPVSADGEVNTGEYSGQYATESSTAEYSGQYPLSSSQYVQALNTPR